LDAHVSVLDRASDRAARLAGDEPSDGPAKLAGAEDPWPAVDRWNDIGAVVADAVLIDPVAKVVELNAG
jgi:hypothetical protein